MMYPMKRRILIALATVLVAGVALSDDFEPMMVRQVHPSGITVELWSDEDTWQADPQKPEYGHSYRNLRVRDADGELLMEQILPVDRSLDFAYRLPLESGDAPLILVMGTFQFFLLDLTDPSSPALTGPVQPLSWGDEIIGVDGQSGQIFDLWLSEDGTQLGGAVVHGGCFVLDVSDPSSPERIYYKQDWQTIGYGSPAPCRPEPSEPEAE